MRGAYYIVDEYPVMIRRWEAALYRTELGMVEWLLLAVMVVGCLIVASVYTIVTYEAKDVALESAHQQVYWMARGHALHVLKQLTHHEVVPLSNETVLNSVQIETTIQKSTMWRIDIVAKSNHASERLVILFNPDTSTMVDWKEDQPVSIHP